MYDVHAFNPKLLSLILNLINCLICLCNFYSHWFQYDLI